MPLDRIASNAPRASSVDPHAVTFRLGQNQPTDSFGIYNFANFGGFGPRGSQRIPADKKWAMLSDPQVYASLWLRRTSVLYDGVQVLNAHKYREPDFERGKMWQELVSFAFGRIDRGLYSILMEVQEADWWKNIVADCIWTEKTWRGKQWLLPDILDVHMPGDYLLHRQDGKIIGVQPYANGVAATDENGPKVYADEKFFVYCFRPDAYEWDGTDLARITWIPYFKKNQGHPKNLMYMDLFANPSLVGIAPEDAPKEVPLLGADGMPIVDRNTGRTVMVTPQQAMSKGLENFGGGGSFTVIPPKAKMQLLEAQGDGRLFVTFEDSCDWQIMTAILGTGNMTGRAKYGSNASAQTGQSVVSTPVATDSQVIGDNLTKLARTIVAVNAKNMSDLEHAPTVMLGDPHAAFLEKVYTTILANSPFVDERMLDEMCDRLDAPKPDFETLLARMDAARQAPNTVPGSQPPQ